MTNTTNTQFNFDELAAAQSQPEVPVNFATQILAQALAGRIVINFANDEDYTLQITDPPASTDEWHYSVIRYTDTDDVLSAGRSVIYPAGSAHHRFVFENGTAETLTVKVSDGTGIEVEARPPGKKVKRLSLLSGGERSLVAVALLVAIFKARPSPFYIMDEIEAALDDVNLGRLLGILAELRAESQLLVITHQKRTMEIADALYGVSMRQDGVSAVVGQRVGDRAAERVAS